MAENTAIEWADHTFNPWIGCTKVSPACDHCYAEHLMDTRLGRVEWGGERKRTSDAYWRQPLAWNAKAKAEGRRYRVFCASLADVFDNQVPDAWRRDLATMILVTPHLDWLLLTKRIGNGSAMLAEMFPAGTPDHVWLGATICNQTEANRDVPKLMATPARLRFLSIEPLLDWVNLEEAWHGENAVASECWGQCGWCVLGNDFPPLWNCQANRQTEAEWNKGRSGVDWVIVGGESGKGARKMDPEWVRLIRDECASAGVPFLFKQWGAWAPLDKARDRDTMYLTTKKHAGRLLDGVTHDGLPS